MEKRGLGKGLGALIPGADREEHAPTEIPLDQISFNPYQPRKKTDDEKFQELVKSVRMHGILQPVVVRVIGPNKYELVAGERRCRAAAAAGLTRIPATIRDMTNEQSLEAALVENLQREDIGPLEAAHAYHRLAEEFGLTQDEIAFRIGKSRSAVANTLRLLNLPEEIQSSLASGEITEGHARALLGVPDRNDQRAIWRLVVDSHLSVRDTEHLCREAASGNVSRETSAARRDQRAELDPNMAEIEEHLRRLFGTRVTINIGKDRGKIEIEFYNEDDLNRILGLLGAV